MKIFVPDSAVGLDAFADYFRYPNHRNVPAPLIIWVGGAIGIETYEARRSLVPGPILSELDQARGRLGFPPCDALLLSTPPTLADPEGRVERFRRFLAQELFPRLPPPIPTTLGFVGNSFGAYLAGSFARERPDALAFASIAGVGLWEALSDRETGPPAQLKIRCYANEEDFAGMYAMELQAELATRGRELDLIERPGDHPFKDYAENGSISDAFEFVLRTVVQ